MVVEVHEDFVSVLAVVQQDLLVSASASEDKSLLQLGQPVPVGVLRSSSQFLRSGAVGHGARVGQADDLAVVRLHESLLHELLRLERVDANVSNLVTAGKLRAIWADPDAPNRVDHVVQIDTTLILQVQQLPILTPIKRTGFEMVKGSLR